MALVWNILHHRENSHRKQSGDDLWSSLNFPSYSCSSYSEAQKLTDEMDYTVLDMLWHVCNFTWRPWRLVTTTSWLSINSPPQSRRRHMIGHARHRSGDIIMTSWHSWPPRPLTRLTLSMLHTDDSLVANILLFTGYLFLHMLFDDLFALMVFGSVGQSVASGSVSHVTSQLRPNTLYQHRFYESPHSRSGTVRYLPVQFTKSGL